MIRQLSVLLLLCISTAVHAQRKANKSFYKPLPAKHAAVNDFAAILSVAQRQSLENKLTDFNKSTGNALVIITHTSLQDDVTGKVYTVEAAAAHYASNWGIGDKKKNNGVLIFLSKNDRKVRIATGKGITQILTNDECQHIIDNDIVPAFKAGDYYRGLDDAASSIMQKLSPEQFGSGQAASAQNQENATSSFTTYNSSNITGNNGNSIFAIVGFSVTGLFIIAILSRAIRSSRPSLITSSGYNSHYHHSSRVTANSSVADSFASSSGSFSSDSFSASSDSSSSSSSDSGSSSDGGGASGNW